MIYAAFGLSIDCAFDLRDISLARTAAPDHPCDVTIIEGDVPTELADAVRVGDVLEKNAQHALLRINDVADFLISCGNRIVIARRSGCVPDTLETYLFGSVFGILLQQREVFSLHVGAVETREGLVAFCGPSGAGKSTIVTELNRVTGCPIFCDDVASVSMVDGVPFLNPGASRIKLCRDALQRFGISKDGLAKDHTGRDKYKLHLDGERSSAPRELHTLIGLSVAADAAIRFVTGASAFSLVHSAFYRPELFDIFGTRKGAAALAARLTSEVDVFRFDRPLSSRSDLRPVLDLISK
jgi:hypothetical protein